MKKILLLFVSLAFALVPLNAHSEELIELEQIDQIDQQQEGTELNKAELDGLLSAACASFNQQSQTQVAREIVKEAGNLLSGDKLEVLVETVLEIQELPSAEKLELCEYQ